MSEEQNPSQQSAEEPPRPASLPEDQEWNHVEFDERTQKRFNRVYAEMKSTKEIIRKMGEDNSKLVDKLEEMEGRQAQQATDDRVTTLRTQEKEALEAGEYDRAGEIRDKITDFKVDAKIPKEKPKKEEPKVAQWLTEERAATINSWVNEKNDKGELLHPWADPGHKEHKTSLHAARVIIEDNPEAPLEDILEQIGKVNERVITKRSTAAVLSTGGDAPKPKPKTSLSEDEKKIATAMGRTQEQYAAAKEKYL